MEKRIILFLVISLVIILGYDKLLKELGIIPDTPSSEQQLSDIPVAPRTTHETIVANSGGKAQAGEEGEIGADIVSRIEALEEIETSLYRASLTNRGAQIKSWKLKHYLTQGSDESEPIEFVYPEGHFTGPLSVRATEPAMTKVLESAVYQVSRDFELLSPTNPTGTLTYTFRDEESGIAVKKELTFHDDSYVVDVVIKTEGLKDGIEVLLGTNFGVVEWGQGFIGALGPAWMIGETLEKEDPEPEIRRTGDLRWAALQDKYFILSLIHI